MIVTLNFYFLFVDFMIQWWLVHDALVIYTHLNYKNWNENVILIDILATQNSSMENLSNQKANQSDRFPHHITFGDLRKAENIQCVQPNTDFSFFILKFHLKFSWIIAPVCCTEECRIGFENIDDDTIGVVIKSPFFSFLFISITFCHIACIDHNSITVILPFGFFFSFLFLILLLIKNNAYVKPGSWPNVAVSVIFMASKKDMWWERDH